MCVEVCVYVQQHELINGWMDKSTGMNQLRQVNFHRHYQLHIQQSDKGMDGSYKIKYNLTE